MNQTIFFGMYSKTKVYQMNIVLHDHFYKDLKHHMMINLQGGQALPNDILLIIIVPTGILRLV